MRRSWFLLLLLVLVAFATPALASEPGPEGEASPGLMDIDPLAVGMAIGVFVILVIVLSKVAWKPILNGLKAREATIQKAVDDAQTASTKAQEVMKQYEGKLAHAADEARAILEEAKKDALALRAQIDVETRKTAEATTQRAVKEIEQARVTAWDGLVKDAARLATETAARMIGKQLDASGHATLVDDVVGQIQAARAGRKS